MSDLLALLFFIITIALRNIRISISLCKKKQQQINARKKDSAEAKEAVGASSDLQALSPSRSRRSSRPRVLSPGARTTREPFGPPGMRRS